MPDSMNDRARPADTQGRRVFVGALMVFLLVSWFYYFIGIPPLYPVRFLKEDDGDYYNRLAEGFLAGRLGFKADPPPVLATLANPYDPAQRAQAGIRDLHDASYYKGRYYLYFGPGPVLVLFLPFKALTGYFFPQPLAAVLFCIGGYACSLGLFLGLRRRYFPGSSGPSVTAAAVLLGFGNFCAPMIARNSVWELPIAAAYFFCSLGFWLLFLGWDNEARRFRWWLGAGLAFGLTVASRPNFVFLGAIFVLLGFLQWRAWKKQGALPPLAPQIRSAIALLAPFSAIVALLLLYNYARFDQLFEFGQKYQLAGNDQVNAKMISRAFFPINFYYNFLAPAQWSRYFPFVQTVRGYMGALPPGHAGAEDPYGVLVNMPFAWLAMLTPLLWFRYFRANQEIAGWLRLFALSFFAVAAVTVCFTFAANRYMVDFLAPLLLVSALGLLMVNALARSSIGWRVGWAAVLAMTGFTAIFTVLVTLQHNDLFERYRPALYARLAAALNRPAFWWDQTSGTKFGPVEFTAVFPRDKIGKPEPLMVTGSSYKSDYFYIIYQNNLRQARLAFTHSHGQQLMSQPIPVDFSRPHRIGITAGSLYPMPSHPFFNGWKEADIKAAKRRLQVTLDGVPYLETETDFYESSPGFVTVGQNQVSGYVARDFTGKITAVERRAVEPVKGNAVPGSFLQLAVVLPKGATGRREPLVATGSRDLFFVQYVTDATVRFGFQHEGAEPALSAPVGITPGEVQLVDVSLGSFYPEPKNAREWELSRTIVLRLNGQTLWVAPQAFQPLGTDQPVLARNPAGLEGYAPEFTGKLVAHQPVQPFPASSSSPFAVAPYWLERGNEATYGPMRLLVELPRERLQKPEPLVVAGAAATVADYAIFAYPALGQMSLWYVHSSAVPIQSPPLAVDVSLPQLIELDLPFLYPSEGDEFFATRTLAEISALKKPRARIRVNNRVLFDTIAQGFESAANEITIGEDRLEKVFGGRFSGRVLAVERATLATPAGLAEEVGPLELSFTFSPNLLPRTETLLATGEGATQDSLLLVYERGGKAKLSLKTAKGVTKESAPFALDDKPHVLRIAWPGLNPEAAKPKAIDAAKWTEAQHAVKILLDGNAILEERGDFTLANPQPLVIGGQTAGGATFTGRFKSIRRLPAAP